MTFGQLVVFHNVLFWTLTISWTVSYDITVIHLSVHPSFCLSVHPSVCLSFHLSLSFLKIGSLVFLMLYLIVADHDL